MKFEENDSFEISLDKLEKIVSILEEGKQTLDEMLFLYEEGIKLYRYCNNIIDKSEQKIKILTDNETFRSFSIEK
ncbi:exodeoxyribonuclease VII small subunit [Lutibacter sp. B2]|nr:exodeoxyribonuclease VII small subunit [Lutibacter sp. B2]